MHRRRLLQHLLSTTFLLPLAARAHTDPARWSPFNARRLEALIAQHGSRSAHYNAARRPYCVFDWDNTCIMNDCEEALFMYQASTLAYQLTAEEFGAVLRQDVPRGPLRHGAQSVEAEAIAADLEADYRWLLGARAAGTEWVHSAQFEDFRAKLLFMYEAICETHPIEIGYTWIIRFYANMTPAQLQDMALASHRRGLGDSLRKVSYTSPASLPGRAGIVEVGHFHGLRINEEIRALMHALRENGIDVYVSTASLDDVVRVFAGDPSFGYGVAPENVIGLRLDMRDGRYTSNDRQGWHFNWGPGKSAGIRTQLGARGEPLMVFGDSDGDAWMLRDFPSTRLGVIVNRLKGGEIGALCRTAAETLGRADARFVLQGRDENTGLSLPQERTLPFGMRDARLLVTKSA